MWCTVCIFSGLYQHKEFTNKNIKNSSNRLISGENPLRTTGPQLFTSMREKKNLDFKKLRLF